jgi:carbonic anhydrase/acetyltransferase-like protein (isoleucine patch superfamily)
VTIGHGAVIHACRLEHKSFVGMGATVMDATVVQTHAMVAAGAMVPYRKTIASGEIWAGNPASFFRKLSDEEIQYIQTSAQHYVADAKAYRLD